MYRERWFVWHGILFEEPNPTGSRPRDLIGLYKQQTKTGPCPPNTQGRARRKHQGDQGHPEEAEKGRRTQTGGGAKRRRPRKPGRGRRTNYTNVLKYRDATQTRGVREAQSKPALWRLRLLERDDGSYSKYREATQTLGWGRRVGFIENTARRYKRSGGR